ncbi:hypothetical protein NP493_597g03013 [Ridgeia piscesae]|uniref:Mitochondrial inner membrane protease subunit n=1 Tax=Ridgeia piscesae TaxID=27915 RepID=A0AAD9KTX6_RIDPI|nr:hypothetical protein NP493_597g03013 [Ridgeia piscesae]
MWKRVFLRTVGMGSVLIQYGCIAHCTLEFVGDFVVCTGPSMMPTIKSNDIVITEHISVGRRNIEVGDIVVARSPHNPTQHICKRVLGLEGDWIDNPPPHYSHRYIPKGYVWLEGDNKDNSTDSRSYGPVPYALLRSRVFFKVWPVHDIGSMSHNYGKERND